MQAESGKTRPLKSSQTRLELLPQPLEAKVAARAKIMEAGTWADFFIRFCELYQTQ